MSKGFGRWAVAVMLATALTAGAMVLGWAPSADAVQPASGDPGADALQDLSATVPLHPPSGGWEQLFAARR